MLTALTTPKARVVAAVVAGTLVMLSAVSARAFDIPPNDGFVTDAAHLLTPAQEGQLENDLTLYQRQTGNEIAVVTVPSLGGEAAEDVGLQIGRKWGIGTKEHSNGILILISPEDRTIRFDVGYGLEGAVPDIVTSGVREQYIVPAFRSGQYYEGLIGAIDALKKHIAGEYVTERYDELPRSESFSVYSIFFIFLAAQWLLSILGRTKSWWLGGVFGSIGGLILAGLYSWWLSIPVLIVAGLLLDCVVSKNYRTRGRTKWWAGGGWGPGGFGGGSRGGGGGFGGFGGGSFGGGGSTGKW